MWLGPLTKKYFKKIPEKYYEVKSHHERYERGANTRECRRSYAPQLVEPLPLTTVSSWLTVGTAHHFADAFVGACNSWSGRMSDSHRPRHRRQDSDSSGLWLERPQRRSVPPLSVFFSFLSSGCYEWCTLPSVSLLRVRVDLPVLVSDCRVRAAAPCGRTITPLRNLVHLKRKAERHTRRWRLISFRLGLGRPGRCDWEREWCTS